MAKEPNLKKLKSMPVNFGMLDDAIQAVLDGVQKMFDKLELKVDYMHSDLKHQIDDLKYDTPSMKEFNDLKSCVDAYHPAS